MKEGSL